jgi:hypothetical protein
MCWRTFANTSWRSVQTFLVLLHTEAGGTPAFQSFSASRKFDDVLLLFFDLVMCLLYCVGKCIFLLSPVFYFTDYLVDSFGVFQLERGVCGLSWCMIFFASRCLL